MPKVDTNHACLAAISLDCSLNPSQDGSFGDFSQIGGWVGAKSHPSLRSVTYILH